MEKIKKYNFLHNHVAREAHIYELLDEIANYQAIALRQENGKLATLDILKASRKIKIPFTPARNKNILYLLELLVKNYPEEIRSIASFRFTVDPASKKLDIKEEVEYTVSLSNEDFNRLQETRDRESAESLLDLLGKFRLFNLTKLMKKSRNRNQFSRIIKSEIDSSIFVFKNYSVDSSNLESTEDYCFHKKNYDAVIRTLNMENLKKIISVHSVQIERRLKNFGILNADFSDFRDNKLDYLLNILLNDIPASLTPKERVDVKNFNSLRLCLQKADRLIDPLLTISNDLVAFIRENGIASQGDILALFNKLNGETLSKWIYNNRDEYRIITFRDAHSVTWYIDGNNILRSLSGLMRQVIYNREEFELLSHSEKHRKRFSLEILCNAGRELLLSDERTSLIMENDENTASLRQLIKEYDEHIKQVNARETAAREKPVSAKKSIFSRIMSFILSLFRGRKLSNDFGRESRQWQEQERGHVTATLTGPARSLYEKIRENSARIIPLSNYVEYRPENQHKIDRIIQELRDHNLKIIIPVYDAPAALYPKKSSKVLIPDVEYLLVNPEIAQTPESIREFTLSLEGYKLKDEIIPGRGILLIENYLLTICRQRKASARKRG